MKKFFIFACVLILSIATTYSIGCYEMQSFLITEWTTNGINYFVAITTNLTLFGSLWAFDQPQSLTITAADSVPKEIEPEAELNPS